MKINSVFKYNNINVSYTDKMIYIKTLADTTTEFLREIFRARIIKIWNVYSNMRKISLQI